MLNSRFTRIAVVALIILVAVGAWWLFSPKTLLQTSGNGAFNPKSPITKTKSFTTHGKWSVTYTYTPTSDSDNMCNFGYVVVDSNGFGSKKDKDVVVLSSGGTHTMHYNDSDRHYLIVSATCPWNVSVKGQAIKL